MATGMSRTIDGKVLQSERPGHFMMEVWNPLGVIGCITAFNFPVAVAGWNAAIALICGNMMIWKGSESTNLCSIATTKIVADVLNRNGFKNVFTLCQGDGPTIGSKMVDDHRVNLISFTGSTAVGRQINKKVSERFGKTVMELGGNNAAIIMDDADTELALKACVFAAVGTTG
jgi:aldehyde dehydrogenase family 7 protein A1